MTIYFSFFKPNVRAPIISINKPVIDKTIVADSPALGKLAEDVRDLCLFLFLRLVSFKSSSFKILSAIVLKSLLLRLTVVALGILIVVGLLSKPVKPATGSFNSLYLDSGADFSSLLPSALRATNILFLFVLLIRVTFPHIYPPLYSSFQSLAS